MEQTKSSHSHGKHIETTTVSLEQEIDAQDNTNIKESKSQHSAIPHKIEGEGNSIFH